MSKNNKKQKPSVFGGYDTDSNFQKMNWDEFRGWAGGRLATALFRGKFEDELDMIIQMAHARGQKCQWELDNEKI